MLAVQSCPVHVPFRASLGKKKTILSCFTLVAEDTTACGGWVPSKSLEPLECKPSVPSVPKELVPRLLPWYLQKKDSKACVTEKAVLGQVALVRVLALLLLVRWVLGLGCELHQPLVNKKSKELVSEKLVLWELP